MTTPSDTSLHLHVSGGHVLRDALVVVTLLAGIAAFLAPSAGF